MWASGGLVYISWIVGGRRQCGLRGWFRKREEELCRSGAQKKEANEVRARRVSAKAKTERRMKPALDSEIRTQYADSALWMFVVFFVV